MTDTSTNPPDGKTPPDGSGVPSADAQVAFAKRLKGKKPKVPRLTLKEAETAYNGKDWDKVKQLLDDKGTDQKHRTELINRIVQGDRGREAMKADPKFAAIVLGQTDPALLKRTDIFDALGDKTADVAAETVLKLAGKSSAGDGALDREKQRDPELFKMFAKKVPKAAWNDEGLGLGAAETGLGPRVCAALFSTRGFDQICALIDLDVDTTRPARSQLGDVGVYSDFVTPLQHQIQPYMADIPKLGTNAEEAWNKSGARDRFYKERVEGAQKIFAKLEATGQAISATKWQEVEKSELVSEFKKNPGTIWGFENMRAPFVAAAHDEDEGARPVRMMEIWAAIKPVLTKRATYEELFDNPKKAIKELVDKAVDGARAEMKTVQQYGYDPTDREKSKFAAVAGDMDKVLDSLRKQATTFLEEFVRQVPRGSFTRAALDNTAAAGQKPDSVSKLSGIDPGKFMGSAACKAGLWAAKINNEPVYYCLDGIKMDDVFNYKKVKYKAIEDYIAGTSDDAHSEVITMKEVREILRNWDDLKDTVKFVRKGNILKGDDLKAKIDTWIKAMEDGNAAAGRAPAPPRKTFTKEVAAIDPKLPALIDKQAHIINDDKLVDMDVRDIVRKSGYLTNMSKTNPDYTIKYLVSKCEVLVDYMLLSPGLADAAIAVGRLAAQDHPPAGKKQMKVASDALVAELQKCAPIFRKPLAESLMTHQVLKHSKKLKKMGK